MTYAWRGMAGLLLAFALGAVAGCASQAPLKAYEGPVRAPAELALLSAPEQIEVLSIDGKEAPPRLFKGSLQAALLPGEHVLSLRYVEFFQLNADEHDIVRSKPAALRFTATAGSQYRLEIPKQPDHDAARKFAKSPQFRLVDEEGRVTESMPIKSYAEASLIDTLNKALEGQDEPARPVTNLDLLKDVWSRSTPEEKEAFRSWLDQQVK